MIGPEHPAPSRNAFSTSSMQRCLLHAADELHIAEIRAQTLYPKTHVLLYSNVAAIILTHLFFCEYILTYLLHHRQPQGHHTEANMWTCGC